MPDSRSSIYERAVEEVMAGCGHEGFHVFNGVYGGDGKPISIPDFDAAARLTKIKAEMAKKATPTKVE